MHVNKYDAGVFSWVDLETRDLDVAKAFYTQMFDWDIEDTEIPQGVYSTAKLGGRSVCGMFTAPPEQDAPAHWNTYVTVDDVESASAKVEPLGGSVLMPPFDVMVDGRMAVVSDRDGAVISLWQPRGSIGAQVVNEPNAFCWNELYTKSLDAAREFYNGLFGWKLQPHDAMNHTMLMIQHQGREIGTAMELKSEWGPVPPHWMVYFAVEDCDGWVERSKGLGAQTFMEPWDLPEVGRFAGVVDPQGARLMIIQLAQHAASVGGDGS